MNMWQTLVQFFKKYDTQGVVDAVRRLKWEDLTHHYWLGLAAACLLVYLVCKRRFRFLLFLLSALVFVHLLQDTLPGAGQPIPLSKILTFIGGSVALVVLNLYFWTICER